MEIHNQNQTIKIKRLLIKCVALLFVIYVLADISVLQAYCGNESVGIPPSHHLAKSSQDSKKKEPQVQAEQNNLDGTHEQEKFPNDCGDDCCFCCSTHVTINHYTVDSRILEIKLSRLNPSSYENKHSNTGLRYLFRPPRIA